ncbi:MAG: hypothetical protein IJN03_02685 [Bacilli bacterium]|nr:hypothetical protein [Clostridia bacterium]MBQ6687410.1 hypothetical protein [Bacilli bacterium]
MKPKRKLKNWVKVTLVILPIAVIISQLFLIGLNIKKIAENQPETIIITESRCYCG